MRATKTITKRRESERVPCNHGVRSDYGNGGVRHILLETRLRADGTIGGGSFFLVEMELHEARYYAMELLAKLDEMQSTKRAPATPVTK